ncbi:MAG: PQQ-binding-like beta-propeller repeat protein [Chloroflexota bacterium]|nr:PQQ-binding-like beta-propeller repeat protein [Chloroflexota bacterium]
MSVTTRSMLPRIYMGVVAGVLALLCTVLGLVTIPAMMATRGSQSTAGDWTTYLGDNAHSGYNALESAIKPTTAPHLRHLWTHSAASSISTQPVVTNGRVFWGSGDGYEHATDSNTNASLWATYLGVTYSTGCFTATFGVTSTATIATVGSTLIDFVGGGNGTFYALNAMSGTIIWRTVLGSSPARFIWSSPVVYAGHVYVGLASLGDCPLVQGALFEMNATSGAIEQTFHVVPAGCTGGGIWSTPTIDEAKNLLYVTTGNDGPCLSREPYTFAVVQLNATSLAPLSSWQVPPSQRGTDGDFGSTPTLFSATINGSTTSMLGVANKNGVYYAFRRSSISAGSVWTRQIATGGGGCPQCGDGSISPSTWDGTTLYTAGGHTLIGGQSCAGGLRALNPATGAIIWAHCLLSGPVLGATMGVPGLVVVCQGHAVLIVSSSTGNTLFSFVDPKNLFYGAPVISGGRLYVGNLDGNLYAFKPAR